MNKSEICIVIPIYKETLNEFEVQSVLQCITVLSEYKIYFVCPVGLKIDFYKENFSAITNFTYFDKNYFENLTGYNRLLLTPKFYQAFNQYEYMLIYQTDCYVFRDELLDWAEKSFDYIGGIWFEEFVGNPYLGSKLWHAGNGGFSLRKIKSLKSLLESKKTTLNLHQLIQEKKELYFISRVMFLKQLFLLPLNVFGYQNNYKYLAEQCIVNEDIFFIEIGSKNKELKTPEVNSAVGFSWDRCPAYLYEKYGKLPFGVHAWYRSDYSYEGNLEFWTNFINVTKRTIQSEISV